MLLDEGRDADDERIRQVGVENIWNCILMFVTLHSESCNFASRWLLFCMASSNDLFGSQISNIFLPHIEWVTFCCREFYIPYENQLHSLGEYTSFFTRIHFILVRNVVGSRIEHKILSAGNNYFPGLKILYSRQENIAINVRNKIKAISLGIQSIFNHFIINIARKIQRCESGNLKRTDWTSEKWSGGTILPSIPFKM